MTLSRQLLLSGLVILLCMFLGLTWFVIENTQDFLNEQLATHSQDTATALGLSLTHTMKEGDDESAKRMVDAVWDRGYYKSIVVENANGSPLVSKYSKQKILNVPNWFVQVLELQTAKQDAQIMDGWLKVGRVIVESHPGLAYQQIWTTFIDSIKWFLVTALIASVFGGVLLYIILRPLRAITKQAAEICNQNFAILDKLPWTIDLRKVVEAMNNMSMRLKNMFEEQSKATEQYREQAYKDPLTKLGNRRYFDMQFDYLINDPEKATFGMLLLIELRKFKEYNDKHGYEAGDELLVNTAKTLENTCQHYENAIVGHVGGAGFMIALPNKTKEVGIKAAEEICHGFNEFASTGLSKEQDVGHIGITPFHPGDMKKDLLSQADMALRAAQTQGANELHYVQEAEQKEVHGAQEWADIFKDVVENNKVILHFQETQMLNTDPDTKVYETLMRLKLADDKIVSAGIFMPMAERLNQVIAMDKLVISNVVDKIIKSTRQDKFTINLSPASMEDDGFRRWIFDKVKSLGNKADQIIMELPEYGVINRLDLVREFFLKVSSFGGNTSIDHYGKNFTSFGYLHNLKVKYLKIDGGFIRNIDENEENQFFIRSLIDIAHSLDIFVVAEAIETEQEYLKVKQLKVDGAQGYFIAKPKELDY